MVPKLRTFVPVLVRGQEGEGVKFWGFGKTVYQEILGYITDPDYGDITVAVNGRDLTIEYKSARRKSVLLILLQLLELNLTKHLYLIQKKMLLSFWILKLKLLIYTQSYLTMS